MEAFDARLVMGTRIAQEWDASERSVARSRVQDEQAEAARRLSPASRPPAEQPQATETHRRTR
jgi:hypothetical protein